MVITFEYRLLILILACLVEIVLELVRVQRDNNRRRDALNMFTQTFILYFAIYSAVIRTLSTSCGEDVHLIKPALYSAISFNIGDVCGCAFLKSAVYSAIGPATTHHRHDTYCCCYCCYTLINEV